MLIEKAMDLLHIPRRYIMGCDATGNADSCLMTRYFLIRSRFGNLYLHVFHRSDEDRELHDHPWDFWTLIIWPGYYEQTPHGRFFRRPGSLLRRPATFSHRVETINDGQSVSLVWVSPRRREWGFFTDSGWVYFKEFFVRKGC